MQNVSKRSILWIVPLITIFILWYLLKPSDGQEYISYIQKATLNSDSSVSFESALNDFCDEEKWIYFRTNNRQHVVEFQGACPVHGQEKSKVNLQFVVKKDLTDFTVGAMLLEGQQQTPEQRDAFLNRLVSSDNENTAP